jgi:hypothetical protein
MAIDSGNPNLADQGDITSTRTANFQFKKQSGTDWASRQRLACGCGEELMDGYRVCPLLCCPVRPS